MSTDEEGQLVPLCKLFLFSKKRDKFYLISLLLSSIVVGVAFPVNMFVYQNVINTLMNPNNVVKSYVATLKPYVKAFFGVAMVTFASAFIRMICFSNLASRQGQQLKLKLFDAILQQDIAWMDNQEVATLIAQLTEDAEEIEVAISDKLGQFTMQIVAFCGNIILAFITNWKLALVALTSLPIMISIFFFLIPLVNKNKELEMKAYSVSREIALETLKNVKTVMALNAQKRCVNRFIANLHNSEKYFLRKVLFLALAVGLISFTVFGLAALVFYVGFRLYRNDNIESGEVILVFLCVVTGSLSFGQSIPHYESIMAARISGYAIFKIIDREPSISYKRKGLTPKEFRGDIEFIDVSFRYPARPDVLVLKKLSIKIPHGKMIAFVGPSGSGKSTIIQLILRYYLPEKGQVFVDGLNLEEIDLHWYRSNLALVQQESKLFSWTIKKNIQLGKLGCNDEEIVEATALANAYDFIMNTEQNFQTKIGEGGSGLSGGQKQRMAIAMAVLRDPTLLLLDEATSALDNISEMLVQSSIEKMRQSSKRTIIVIAHRLSTIQNADMIVVMKDGVINEIGDHNSLMKKEGLYYTMATKQQGKSQKHKQKKVFVRKSQSEIQSLISIPEVEFKSNKDWSSIQYISDFFILVSYCSKQWYFIVIGMCGSLFMGFIFPFSSLIYAQVYQIFQYKYTDMQLYDQQALLFPLLMLVPAVCTLIAQLCKDFGFGKTSAALQSQLRQRFLEAVIHQELGWFDRPENHSGLLNNRLTSEVSLSNQALTLQLSVFIEVFTNMSIAVVISFVINFQLSMIFLGLIPVLVVSGIGQAKLSPFSRGASSDREHECSTFISEALANFKTVHSYNLHSHFHDYFKELLKRRYYNQKRRQFFFGIFGGIGLSVLYFTYTAVFFFGGYLLDSEDITISNLMRVFSCLTISSAAITQAISMAPNLEKCRKAARHTLYTIARKPKIDSTNPDIGITPSIRLKGKIEFRNIYFYYPTRPELPILQNCSLKLHRLKHLALVGQSGCGKSTLLQLILRYYDPCPTAHFVEDIKDKRIVGQVLLDGYDVTTLNVRWLRSNIGVVSQESNLFNMTIAENIAYGSDVFNQDNIYEAGRKAHLDEFVNKLPKKYETMVGFGGGQLSGGQRQRISIARAMYLEPAILLLDEATSALDMESETQVTEALNKIKNTCSSVSIAHRLATIQNSDLIVVMDAGEVVESGTHNSLMHLHGYYYQLRTQQ